ncbi:hypothetical protein [Streptomyces sp. ADI95-16]|uniref:hypothetical protein n=1 Tax=Streptomyces sp. ADI95-16 TaxID=1522758 RepID=UPI0013DDF7C1
MWLPALPGDDFGIAEDEPVCVGDLDAPQELDQIRIGESHPEDRVDAADPDHDPPTAGRGDPVHEDRRSVARDLKAVIDRVVDLGAQDMIGVTGSFLVGCFNARSDVDLVCYGRRGYEAARELFLEFLTEVVDHVTFGSDGRWSGRGETSVAAVDRVG